jgi:hypothetical protein
MKIIFGRDFASAAFAGPFNRATAARMIKARDMSLPLLDFP